LENILTNEKKEILDQAAKEFLEIHKNKNTLTEKEHEKVHQEMYTRSSKLFLKFLNDRFLLKNADINMPFKIDENNKLPIHDLFTVRSTMVSGTISGKYGNYELNAYKTGDSILIQINLRKFEKMYFVQPIFMTYDFPPEKNNPGVHQPNSLLLNSNENEGEKEHGMANLEKVEVTKNKIHQHDLVLVGTDGLFDHFPPSVITRLVNKSIDALVHSENKEELEKKLDTIIVEVVSEFIMATSFKGKVIEEIENLRKLQNLKASRSEKLEGVEQSTGNNLIVSFSDCSIRDIFYVLVTDTPNQNQTLLSNCMENLSRNKDAFSLEGPNESDSLKLFGEKFDSEVVSSVLVRATKTYIRLTNAFELHNKLVTESLTETSKPETKPVSNEQPLETNKAETELVKIEQPYSKTDVLTRIASKSLLVLDENEIGKEAKLIKGERIQMTLKSLRGFISLEMENSNFTSEAKDDDITAVINIVDHKPFLHDLKEEEMELELQSLEYAELMITSAMSYVSKYLIVKAPEKKVQLCSTVLSSKNRKEMIAKMNAEKKKKEEEAAAKIRELGGGNGERLIILI
jgi:hypothetical protein